MHKRLLAGLLLILSAAAALPAGAQLPATEYEGASALGLALRKLGTTKRVLVIGAHPDDENTQVISELALGQGAQVAYLSLTRGEGGQNGIGSELQEGLGLLRSEELLAARRLDGASQFFTRAYDFGYSKNAEEAFRHWPRDSLLADVVGVVREFRPDVIISIFSGTPADGHGQHQVAGILAREAFDAAGDAGRFSGQLSAGLRPHAPAKLFQALYRPRDSAAFQLETGERDPLLGRSPYQIAMASRSRHRSQDMGRPLTAGPQQTGFELIRARGMNAEVASRGIFSGIDTTLAAAATGASGSNGASERVVNVLQRYQVALDSVRSGADLLNPGSVAPALARAVQSLAEAEALAQGHPDLRLALQAELREARAALAQAAGVVLDATADAERVVPGGSFELAVQLWNGGSSSVTVERLVPALPNGWRATPLTPGIATVAPGQVATRRFAVSVPADAAYSNPYFLESPREGDLYSWGAAGPRAKPFEADPISAEAELTVGGATLVLEEAATFRGLDKMQGEFRRPVQVVPAATVEVEPELVIVPLGGNAAAAGRSFPIAVRVAANDSSLGDGVVRLRLPDGWGATPASAKVAFRGGAQAEAVSFTITPPAALVAGSFTATAVLSAGGREYTQNVAEVDYPHIRPRLLFEPAQTQIRALPLELPPALAVGYVMGAGDAVPDALRQLGIEPVMLGPADLAQGDLGRFDVIVTGIRAYEVRPDLAANNERLLDYARRGGTVIVQYNKYEFPDGGFAPFPVTMARPHDRVTDEAAPVRMLEPEHPILSAPNRITDDDFDGWIQERGLYFLNEWDAAYTPLLEMADEGEDPLHGSLLVAEIGEGHYVYTGLAFFRQLPAGVPGAYRLFANLLSLGAR